VSLQLHNFRANIAPLLIIEIGTVIIGTALMAMHYRRRRGQRPDRDATLLLFKIMLAIAMIGSAAGFLIAANGQ
jgi:hypothetical protein